MSKRFKSVWDAIEDTPEDAENMTLRSALMMALKNHITRAGLTQAQAAEIFGVTQPRVSDLTRGKIDLFSLDALVNMAVAAGLKVDLRISGAGVARWSSARHPRAEQPTKLAATAARGPEAVRRSTEAQN
ncbi:MAG: helix-turn-helix domain-containing protein [Betaproteobacteria bacterium]